MNRVRGEIQTVYAYERGLQGSGIGVAVLDSGVEEHPDLKGRIAFAGSFGRHRDTTDEYGHGTHISGIIGGSGVASGGTYQGVAPRCHFVSLKVLDAWGNAKTEDVIAALQWILAHGKEYRIRLVNISLGGMLKEEEERHLLEAVEAVGRAGYIICAAAGNQGPEEQSITVPGNSRSVITVGAGDDGEIVPSDGVKKVNYSGRGPAKNLICKPDLTAPGGRIMSCSAAWKRQPGKNYCRKSGTSMATPVVCGALALLLEAYPEFGNRQVRACIRRGCRDLGMPRNRQGWGCVDLPLLLQAAEKERT